MRLSEIYQKKITASRKHLELRKAAIAFNEQDYQFAQAEMREGEAGAVAHCIALFGDMPAGKFLDEFKRKTSTRIGVRGRPWLRGYSIVRDFSKL